MIGLMRRLVPLSVKVSIARRVQATSLYWRLRLARSVVYDAARFYRWSAVGRHRYSRSNLAALITMDYHRLEKGLSLKDVRLGFGQSVLERLLRDVPAYVARFGHDETTQIAVQALCSYCEYHESRGHDVQMLRETVASWGLGVCETAIEAGTKAVTRAAIHAAGRIDIVEFFNSRHSVRDFADTPVDIALIRQAVQLAARTPSVCNRQAWRVYTYGEPTVRNALLAIQNGNRGFDRSIDKLLIVACDLGAFTSVGERNQCWVDGGMFAMSLVYALHSLGLGTCCLNWSVEKSADQALKRLGGIPQSDAVMMYIAVGHLPDQFRVATSVRKPVDELLIVADDLAAKA